MTILTWNMWCYNHNLASALEFVMSHDADILCLQEVSEIGVSYLELQTKYDCVVAPDFDHLKVAGHTKKPFYLVTLTRAKVKHSRKGHPQSTRQSYWARRSGWQESGQFQSVDVIQDGELYRIFNVHLECAVGPKIRLGQFARILQHLEPEITPIICGDFNIFGIWYLNLVIGWAFGYSWHDFWLNERRVFSRLFDDLELTNPFHRHPTYPKFRTQLDYILVPKNMLIVHQTMFRDLHGSDHRALLLHLDRQLEVQKELVLKLEQPKVNYISSENQPAI